MKKEIQIIVPKDFSAVTLKDYLLMMKDLEAYDDNEDARTAVLFHHLCKIDVQWIQSLDVSTYTAIKNDLIKLMSNVEYPLRRTINVGGVVYGFEPDLSNMSYGLYVDIAGYEGLSIDDKWAEIMSMLYRPLTVKTGELYDIETYSGKKNPKPFLELGMDIHLGALFFLRNLLMDLLKSTQKSLKGEMVNLPSINTILERSGNPTLQ
jgi:hypothetical protein